MICPRCKRDTCPTLTLRLFASESETVWALTACRDAIKARVLVLEATCDDLRSSMRSISDDLVRWSE